MGGQIGLKYSPRMPKALTPRRKGCVDLTPNGGSLCGSALVWTCRCTGIVITHSRGSVNLLWVWAGWGSGWVECPCRVASVAPLCRGCILFFLLLMHWSYLLLLFRKKTLSLCTYPISKWCILWFINIYFLILKLACCWLLITLCCTTFVCKVFHFAHLISWHSHYSRMEWNIYSVFWVNVYISII
jgi:hypothetical protein